MQGATLLIAATRADQILSELAMHDFQTNVELAAPISTSSLDLSIFVVDPVAPSTWSAPDRTDSSTPTAAAAAGATQEDRRSPR